MAILTKTNSDILFHQDVSLCNHVDPRELTCDLIVGTIKQTEGPVSFEEAAKIVCKQNQVVRDYIGPKLKLRENNRLHEISERVRQDSNIKTIGLKPLVLVLWIKSKEQSEVISKQADQGIVDKDNANVDRLT